MAHLKALVPEGWRLCGLDCKHPNRITCGGCLELLSFDEELVHQEPGANIRAIKPVQTEWEEMQSTNGE